MTRRRQRRPAPRSTERVAAIDGVCGLAFHARYGEIASHQTRPIMASNPFAVAKSPHELGANAPNDWAATTCGGASAFPWRCGLRMLLQSSKPTSSYDSSRGSHRRPRAACALSPNQIKRTAGRQSELHRNDQTAGAQVIVSHTGRARAERRRLRRPRRAHDRRC